MSKVIKHFGITDIEQVVELGIIDWRRTNGLFRNELAAMRAVENILVHQAAVTVFDIGDMADYPHVPGFPGWEHTGNHERWGKKLWNYFHALHQGEISFHDSPDFSGWCKMEGTEIHFWGDLGRVSSSTFFETIIQLNDGDLWFSFPDERTQVVIERYAGVKALRGQMMIEYLGFDEKVKELAALGPISPEVITAMKEGIMKLVDKEASE